MTRIRKLLPSMEYVLIWIFGTIYWVALKQVAASHLKLLFKEDRLSSTTFKRIGTFIFLNLTRALPPVGDCAQTGR